VGALKQRGGLWRAEWSGAEIVERQFDCSAVDNGYCENWERPMEGYCRSKSDCRNRASAAVNFEVTEKYVFIINSAVRRDFEAKDLVVDWCWVLSLSSPKLLRVLARSSVVQRTIAIISSLSEKSRSGHELTPRASVSIGGPSALPLRLSYLP
jgi:hypothetical protein